MKSNDLCQQTLTKVKKMDKPELPFSAPADLVLGGIYYIQNHLLNKDKNS